MDKLDPPKTSRPDTPTRRRFIGLAFYGVLAAVGRAQGQGRQIVAPERGQTLSDQELLQAVILDTPGLEAAKRAGGGHDVAAAKAALGAYLRARTSVPWTINPVVADRSRIKYNGQSAADALAGKVQVVALWHTFPQAEINWFYNETDGRPGLPHNNEWTWQLNRMAWWEDLGRAYQATGDERYARTFVQQFRSWLTQCPPPAHVDQRPGSAWRTIECGIRMRGSWPDAFYTFLHSPAFTDDDLADFLKVCLEHARYLRAHPTTGNWLTMEMSGLYTVGAVFPELTEAAEWRQFAADRLYRDMAVQFLPDGAQIELSPGYHNVALSNVLAIPETARVVGRTNELPHGYAARMERAYDYDLYLMTPDRSLPKFNDSWPENVPHDMAQAARLFPARPDFAWVATAGTKGTPPPEASHAFPYAGYFVMRSGWQPDANSLFLDAGPLGYGHVHQDKLNVVVWAYGRELLFDSGGGSYETSKWRDYATDTFSHNTVLVDGKPQRRQTRDRAANVSRAPIDVHWQSTPVFDFAQGLYDEGYGTEADRSATHRRRVLFVKPDLFVVSDTLTPADAAPHTYQARWHLLPTHTDTDAATQAVTTTAAGQPNLAVVPLLTEGLEVRVLSAQTTPELLGWDVRKDLDPEYVPATTVLHTRHGIGVQRFLTLLLPLRPAAASPVREVQADGPDAAHVTLTDGRRLTVSQDATGALSVIEVDADGKPQRSVKAQ